MPASASVPGAATPTTFRRIAVPHAVRTDGRRITCATMEEKGNEFDIVTF